LLRLIRYAAWAGVAALSIAVVVVGLGRETAPPAPPAAPAIGGPFAMTAQDGRRVTDRDLLGRPVLLFFGFTYCPEICPTTLTDIAGWMEAVGPKADELAVVFVTVDPERDTGPEMAAYLAGFDRRILGLRGTAEELAQMAAAYRVVYRRVPVEGGYTMDHTASVFMIGRDGRFVGTIDYHEDRASAVAKVQRLLTRG